MDFTQAAERPASPPRVKAGPQYSAEEFAEKLLVKLGAAERGREERSTAGEMPPLRRNRCKQGCWQSSVVVGPARLLLQISTPPARSLQSSTLGPRILGLVCADLAQVTARRPRPPNPSTLGFPIAPVSRGFPSAAW